MSKINDWIAKYPKTALISITAIMVAIIAVLTVPAILYIPGLLENIKYLHRQNPTLFFLFVVTPGVITTTCSLIWTVCNAWEKVGKELDASKD